MISRIMGLLQNPHNRSDEELQKIANLNHVQIEVVRAILAFMFG